MVLIAWFHAANRVVIIGYLHFFVQLDLLRVDVAIAVNIDHLFHEIGNRVFLHVQLQSVADHARAQRQPALGTYVNALVVLCDGRIDRLLLLLHAKHLFDLPSAVIVFDFVLQRLRRELRGQVVLLGDAPIRHTRVVHFGGPQLRAITVRGITPSRSRPHSADTTSCVPQGFQPVAVVAAGSHCRGRPHRPAGLVGSPARLAGSPAAALVAAELHALAAAVPAA